MSEAYRQRVAGSDRPVSAAAADGLARPGRGSRRTPSRRSSKTCSIRPGRSRRAKCATGDDVVVLEQRRVGCVEEGARRRGVVVREPSKAEGGELGGDGVGADGERASVDRRLDGRVAESLPRRPEDDDVTGCVGVRHAPVGCRQGAGPEHARGTGPGPRGAPARGRTRPRPARAARTWRPGPRPGRCRRPRSSSGWPASAGARASRRPRARAPRRCRRGRRSGASTSKALRTTVAAIPTRASSRRDSSFTVTWTQAGSSGGGGIARRTAGVATGGRGGAAPPAGSGSPRPPPRRRFVERQRAEVLDHHQIGVGRGVADLDRGGRLGGADGQAGDEPVDGALTGHGADVEAEGS